MNQIVNLESSGEVTFIAKYKLIWYKRDVEIHHENDKFKSYKIELYFENGKSMKDYIVLDKGIINVDLYIKENIKPLMVLWMERCKKNKIVCSNMQVINIIN